MVKFHGQKVVGGSADVVPSGGGKRIWWSGGNCQVELVSRIKCKKPVFFVDLFSLRRVARFSAYSVVAILVLFPHRVGFLSKSLESLQQSSW